MWGCHVRWHDMTFTLHKVHVLAYIGQYFFGRVWVAILQCVTIKEGSPSQALMWYVPHHVFMHLVTPLYVALCLVYKYTILASCAMHIVTFINWLYAISVVFDNGPRAGIVI